MGTLHSKSVDRYGNACSMTYKLGRGTKDVGMEGEVDESHDSALCIKRAEPEHAETVLQKHDRSTKTVERRCLTH